MKAQKESHDAVTHWAKAHGLDRRVVYAVVLKESLGNANATRYEDGFFRRYLEGKSKKRLRWHWPINRSADTERRMRAVSWGPMQVMGQTARRLGFEGRDFTELCDPFVGVEYGCKYLAMMLKIYKRKELASPDALRSALAAYNGGPGNPNYKYADEVLELCCE